MDLVLNNLQRLICHKTQQTKPSLWFVSRFYSMVLSSRNEGTTIIFYKNIFSRLFTKESKLAVSEWERQRRRLGHKTAIFEPISFKPRCWSIFRAPLNTSSWPGWGLTVPWIWLNAWPDRPSDWPLSVGICVYIIFITPTHSSMPSNHVI